MELGSGEFGEVKVWGFEVEFVLGVCRKKKMSFFCILVEFFVEDEGFVWFFVVEGGSIILRCRILFCEVIFYRDFLEFIEGLGIGGDFVVKGECWG